MALLTWNAPVSGRWKLDRLADQPSGHALAIAFVDDLADLEPAALAPDGQQRGAARQRAIQERLVVRVVDIDDRRSRPRPSRSVNSRTLASR